MSISSRFFRVAVIAAALLVPLALVYALVWDRTETSWKVREQVTRGWAADQSVTGPVLVVPFTRETDVATAKGVEHQTVSDSYVIAPDTLSVDARLRPAVRRRSLFDTIVYSADVGVIATFSAASLAKAIDSDAVVDWSRASVVVSAGDSRGLGGTVPILTIGGQRIEAQPLAGGGEGAVLSAPVRLTGPSSDLQVASRLDLKGSSTFAVAGNAKRVTLAVKSPWRHPSFLGRSLPDARDVSDAGFAASWRTGYIALGQPLVSLASASKTPFAAPEIGKVELIQPVDLYGQVGRAVKYGALFIALTLLSFFVFDATGRTRLPMLAYALVGLGLVLFYLLLLALAEYLSLLPAYLIAAAAMISLIAAYSKAILRSARRAGVIAGVLSALYATLYVLLQLEEFALLLGSGALFIALAALMYATRDIAAAED